MVSYRADLKLIAKKKHTESVVWSKMPRLKSMLLILQDEANIFPCLQVTRQKVIQEYLDIPGTTKFVENRPYP